MGTSPLPLRFNHREQEELIWWVTESDGALGRKSIQSSIQSRLEGSQGGFESIDLIEDPHGAFKAATGKIGFHAAGRIKRIEYAWRQLSRDIQNVIAAVWLTPPHRGFEAFGHWANLAPTSKAAVQAAREMRSRIPVEEWLIRLSAKRPDSMSKLESSAVSAINRECERAATYALTKFVAVFR